MKVTIEMAERNANRRPYIPIRENATTEPSVLERAIYAYKGGKDGDVFENVELELVDLPPEGEARIELKLLDKLLADYSNGYVLYGMRKKEEGMNPYIQLTLKNVRRLFDLRKERHIKRIIEADKNYAKGSTMLINELPQGTAEERLAAFRQKREDIINNVLIGPSPGLVAKALTAVYRRVAPYLGVSKHPN